MRLATLISLLMLSLSLPGAAQVKVSLLTASPGNEIYQLEGHSALRLQVPERGDYVVNWGVFDFGAPGFVYRFVKGETDYMAAAHSTERFLEMYRREGRRVTELPLRLTPEEAQRVVELTDINLLPENRTYRYNYIYDNCATRPLTAIERAIGSDTLRLGTPSLPATAARTFRSAMTYYHANYPWYQFGIDLALGSGIDVPMTKRMTTFSPLELEALLRDARRPDGTPVSEPLRVLLAGDDMQLPPTAWYLTPLFWAFVLLALALLCTYVQCHRGTYPTLVRVFDRFMYLLLFIDGCVACFLVFVSVHEATSPNWLLLWVNPFCLIPVLAIGAKRLQKLLFCYQIANFALLTALVTLLIAGVQTPNPAFWPLIAADMLRSGGYIYYSLKSR